jgi:hypothetical protein
MIDDRNLLRRNDFGFRRGENRIRTNRSGEDFQRRPEIKIDPALRVASIRSPAASKSSHDALASRSGLFLAG